METKLWILWRCVSVLVHLIAVLIYGLTFIFQLVHPWGYNFKLNDDYLATLNTSSNLTPGVYTFGWKYKYLTFCNLNFQLLGFFLFLVCDCFKDNYLPEEAIESNFKKYLLRIRDVWFHSVIFPAGMYVCSVFWTLYLIKEDLVVNPNMKGRNPVWLNHAQHTVLVPIIILESIVTYHRRSKKVVELTVMLTVVGTYLVWMLYLGNFHNIWVYGILNDLNSIGKTLFLAGCLIYFIIIYFIGILLHKYAWPQSRIDQYPKQWSPDVISKEHEFEDFRVRQGLIRSEKDIFGYD